MVYRSWEKFLGGESCGVFYPDVIPTTTVMVRFIWYINIYVPEKKEAKRTAYLSVSSDPLQMFLQDR